MECSGILRVIHFCLHLLVAVAAASDFFCESFYNDILTRDPLRFKIMDNATVGTILKKFERHHQEKNTVIFSSGDLDFVDFDKSSFALITKAPLHSKADKTLQIFGNCSEHLEKINYGFSLSLTVLVDVEDVNDPPVFRNLPAYLRIKESVRVGSLLYKVVMKEGFDVRENFYTTKLQITNVSAEGFPGVDVARFFSLDPDGSVYLLQPVDYETDPHKFEISIHAEDLGDPPMKADSTLTFYIQDMDDMSPRFAHKTFHATVIGEKPVETAECRPTKPEVLAEDQDVREKSEVHYEISAGPENADWQELFRLDGTSGRLCQLSTIHRTVLDPLSDRLTFPNYTFVIKGYQVDNRRKYDLAELIVYVADQNKHKPTFTRKLYRASVHEYPKVKTGHQVIQVKAEDKDHGANGVFQYELDGHATRWFSLDSQNGWITVQEPARLDREIYNFFEFKVKAVETDTLEQYWSTARVVVNLEDVNDNTPGFQQHQYSYSLKDNLRPGLPIHTTGQAIRAYDADSGDNGRVVYSVTSTSRRDGDVTFNDYGRFTIDPVEGTLRLTGSLSDLRRRRQHPVYDLQVTATDQARNVKDRKSSSVQVTIRVLEANDFLPMIIPQRGSVMVNESVAIGTLVHTVEVRDRDGDEDVYMKYKIVRGNQDDAFAISKGGRVSVNKPLDREEKEFYKLKIEVSDGKHVKGTSLRIQVMDVNDNTPIFTQEEYFFTVPEHPAIGSMLGYVNATDPDMGPNGRLHYAIRLTDTAQLIKIHEDGRLSVRQKSHLWDREVNQYIRLKVMVSDGGQPPHKGVADVIIEVLDINDNPPAFTNNHYHGWVEEDDSNPKPQFVIMDIPINATDADAEFDHRDVRYSLSGDGSDIFYIDPDRADVITVSPGGLDAEQQQKYKLTIKAVDQGGSGLSSTARLTITVKDVNDNRPKFSGPQHFSVPSNSPPAHRVATLQVTDRDVTSPNNQLIFILKEGGNGKFSVDFQTGDIILAEKLDAETVLPEYHLLVEAVDGGVPRLTKESRITVSVPVNRAPVIRTNTTGLNVDEGLPPGALVATMAADDGDTEENAISGDIEFFIMDDTVPFEVTRHGLIRTKDALDRESQPSYEFQLYVRDQGKPPMTSSALVKVQIDDVNDHAPQFMQPLYKGTVVEDDTIPLPGQIVKLDTNITVTDGDATAVLEEVRYSLHGEDSHLFTIDPHTATVRVSSRGTGRIDREQTDHFNLKVRATDQGGQGLWGEAELLIFVTDVNDMTPIFPIPVHRLVVGDEIREGQVIGMVRAHDKDATLPNNLLLYTFTNDPHGKFSINSHTGEVRALSGIFYPPRQETYQLDVSVTDMGFPPRTAYTTVQVWMNLTDYNDHSPVFHGDTMYYINEGVPVGTLVGTVSVSDEDKQDHVRLAIHADHPVPFNIDSHTGEIRSVAALDYDTGARAYMFTVAAHDRGRPPRTSTTVVSVLLDDINDHPPRFTQLLYHHRVHTVFPPGTLVATPFAYDQVDTVQSVYRYRLEGPDVGLYFYIDEHSGEVRTTDRLVDSPPTTVEYTLLAEDIYNKHLTAKATLVIDVVGQNNSPCCCKVPCAPPNPP